jgi:hypothetical protein
MPTPPDPHVPSLLLAAAARLGWRVVLRDPSGLELGELVDGDSPRHMIVVAGAAPGSVEWALVDAMPRGFAPYWMTRATYEALQAGAIGALRALWISGTHVAALDAERAA